MKSICVLCDAQGNLRAVLSRNGDLVRRELSTQSAPVHLVWMSLAPEGVAPREILDELETNVLPRHAGRVGSGHISLSFYLDMIVAAHLAPLIVRAWIRARGRMRKPFARAWHRVFGGAS